VVNIYHGQLDNVGGGALNRSVESHPPTCLISVIVFAFQFRNLPYAAKNSFSIAPFPGQIDHTFQIFFDLLVLVEIAIDKSLSFGS